MMIQGEDEGREFLIDINKTYAKTEAGHVHRAQTEHT